jgi:hypothetical protein
VEEPSHYWGVGIISLPFSRREIVGYSKVPSKYATRFLWVLYVAIVYIWFHAFRNVHYALLSILRTSWSISCFCSWFEPALVGLGDFIETIEAGSSGFYKMDNLWVLSLENILKSISFEVELNLLNYWCSGLMILGFMRLSITSKGVEFNKHTWQHFQLRYK